MNKYLLEIKKDGLFLGGEPFYLASGDMHYFRYFKGGWKRRLQLMKNFGLTAIQTYVPWNMHEPEEEQYCFDGNLNLKEFFELCQEIGLKVMFRPSVYMCSEWDLGGMPYWLLEKEGMVLRSNSQFFMHYAKRFYKRLAEEFIPYLSTNGGPIIAVAVENEYGSYANGLDYIKATGDYLKELGVDVPLYTTNGHDTVYIKFGSLPEYWTAVNVHALDDDSAKYIREFQPDLPIFIGEFWGGRAQRSGVFFNRQSADIIESRYKQMLEMGAYVDFYMFCGGTNFGYQNGGLVGMHEDKGKVEYTPYETSYDVDAPITEYGETTPKYYACKKVLKNYLESRGIAFTGNDEFEPCKHVETQYIGEVKFQGGADLLDNLNNVCAKKVESQLPLNMEKLGQAYGYVLYTTEIDYVGGFELPLRINGLQDRAIIFGNGEYLGTYTRDWDDEMIVLKIPKEGMKLSILVENLGRVCHGVVVVREKKGITEYVTVGKRMLLNWTCYSLPMKYDNIEKIDYSHPHKPNRPAVFKSEFNATSGIDTFINMKGWGRGVVFVNGFNLGRYWNIGPQETLYLPGELVKEKNTIEIFELHNPKEDMSITIEASPSLDSIKKD